MTWTFSLAAIGWFKITCAWKISGLQLFMSLFLHHCRFLVPKIQTSTDSFASVNLKRRWTNLRQVTWKAKQGECLIITGRDSSVSGKLWNACKNYPAEGNEPHWWMNVRQWWAEKKCSCIDPVCIPQISNTLMHKSLIKGGGWHCATLFIVQTWSLPSYISAIVHIQDI